MTELVQTHLLTPETVKLRGTFELDQIYNGLDCCVTLEIREELGRLSNQTPLIYDFERALQAPALEMMIRGCAIDRFERQKAMEALSATIADVDAKLQRMAGAVWDFREPKTGRALNPNSPKQLQLFFYKALHLPEIWISQKGVRKLSTNREVLEKLAQHYLAMPIISAILTLREHTRSLKVLQTEVDSDGRMRTSYNIAGTETGRWSSSKNAFGAGGNFQNWKERLRRVFVADRGWKLGAIDLEQAESREIGFALGVIFGEWGYLDACEGGDLHTSSARLVWPEMPWTGDLKADRKLAEQIFYRDFTFRDMSKRGGHGVTYVGTPWTMARHLKVPVRVMELFQERFFGAYPGIPKLHLWVANQLQTTNRLCTYFGRERHFLGRSTDDSTLREGVAFMGQSPTGDRMNLGVYKLWEDQELRGRVKLWAQLHDAVYFQYRDDPLEEAEVMKRALALVEIPIAAPSGRVMIVPGEAKVGWNWSRRHDDSKPLDGRKNPFNPDGLVKWGPAKPDLRKRSSAMETVL